MLGAALVAVSLLSFDYAIVLENGRMVRVAEPPELAGDVVLSALGDGTAVSLPRAKVDWKATVELNRQALASDPEAARAKKASKRRASFKVSNRTIEAFAASQPPLAVPSTGAAANVSEVGPSVNEPPPLPVRKPEMDDHGNGPEYWRERARLLEGDRRGAERELNAARIALRREQDSLLYGQVIGSSGSPVKIIRYGLTAEEYGVARARISQLEERVLSLTATVEELRQREADLREDARIAGADPGWLRLPVAYR